MFCCRDIRKVKRRSCLNKWVGKDSEERVQSGDLHREMGALILRVLRDAAVLIIR